MTALAALVILTVYAGGLLVAGIIEALSKRRTIHRRLRAIGRRTP